MKDPNFDLLMKGFTIRSMMADDIAEVKALVESTEVLAFLDREAERNLICSLEKNLGRSQVALDWKTRRGRPEIVGAVIISEGYVTMVQHLVVKPAERRNKIGRQLVRAGLKRMFRLEGSAREVYIMTGRENLGAQLFWENFGADKRAHGDLCLLTLNLRDVRHRSWLKN